MSKLGWFSAALLGIAMVTTPAMARHAKSWLLTSVHLPRIHIPNLRANRPGGTRFPRASKRRPCVRTPLVWNTEVTPWAECLARVC
jgi:hypothetical protein